MGLFGRRKQEPQTPRRVVRDDYAGRPQAFSYHANRTEQEYNVGRAQPREQDVRRRELLIRFWKQRLSVLLFGFVALICVIYTLHLDSSPHIIPLTTSSNDYFLQSTDVYRKTATELLASSVLNGNKITIDTDNIRQELEKKYPELSSVAITLPLMGHRPYIYIAPTTPSVILAASNGSYVLDDTGRALLETSQVSDIGKLHLPTVVDTTNLPVKTDSEALPATSVQFITYLKAEFQAKGVQVDSLVLSTTPYELDVTPKGAKYFVKFNLHDHEHAREQVGTMFAVQKRLNEQGITPSQYIDVRLVGRAYYL